MRSYVMLCYMLCYVISYVMLCYMLCYVMLCMLLDFQTSICLSKLPWNNCIQSDFIRYIRYLKRMLLRKKTVMNYLLCFIPNKNIRLNSFSNLYNCETHYTWIYFF